MQHTTFGVASSHRYTSALTQTNFLGWEQRTTSQQVESSSAHKTRSNKALGGVWTIAT